MTRPTVTGDREADELMAPRSPLGLPRPAYEGRSLPNLSASIVRAAAVRPSRSAPPTLPPLEGALDPFQGRRTAGTVVHFLVDGLGWDSFRRASADGALAAPGWTDRPRPITTVFPTSTVAALTSSSTAVAPASHGLVGYRQYLPGFGVVADLLRMSPLATPGHDMIVQSEWKPSHISGSPTVFRGGLSAIALSRDRFEPTGFTRVLYDGARYAPYATAADFAHELARLLDGPNPPAAIFAYWDELDTIQHLRGADRPDLFALELSHVADLVAYTASHVSRAVARTTTLVVTGDHGQVPARLPSQVRIDRLPAVLREMSRPLAGDRRAGFLAARPGRVEALEGALTPRLPEGSRIVPMEEAVRAGLFGPSPHHPELMARLGDLLVLPPPPSGLTQRLPGSPPPRRHLSGAHGGLDRAELLVPLIAAPLAEFAAPARRTQQR
ncbi:MAG: alkaline phosphatase family protein [Thermoplasmata archaeon]|nr:alkaline phosphatase family protein [Thermoplasmata archaeon]